MSHEPLHSFDHWADDIAQGDPQRLLLALGRIMRFLDEKQQGTDQLHPSLVPEALRVNDGNEVDIVPFEKSEVKKEAYFLFYRAPELIDDAPTTPQGQVYAIAAIAYRAFAGHPPTLSKRRLWSWQPDLALSIPGHPELSKIILGALSTDPTKRPQNLRELHAALFQAFKPLAVAKYPKVEKRFPVNLTVGKDVSFPVAKLISSADGWQVKWRGLEPLGITIDSASNVLVCAPTVSGEHRIEVELSHPDRPNHPLITEVTLVTINPDPDSLWKYIEPDPEAPYQKNNTASEKLTTPFSDVFAASQRGRSHAHEGSFREDDYRVSFHVETGWHLLVAADGAGSAKLSRRGSQLACETSQAFLQQWLEGNSAQLDEAIAPLVAENDPTKLKSQLYDWLVKSAFTSLKAIQKEAASLDPPRPAKDFHTTLLICAAKKFEAGWVLVSFTVGDGGVGIRQGDGTPIAFCEPDSGEFSGQTVFLTVNHVFDDAEKNMSRLHAAFVKDLSAVVLMTDGITDPRFPTEASLKDKSCWDAFWTEVSEIAKFDQDGADVRLLKWLSFKSPGNHDDRTVVFLLPSAGKDEVAEGNKSK
jgi:serine/threonine protein kinase